MDSRQALNQVSHAKELARSLRLYSVSANCIVCNFCKLDFGCVVWVNQPHVQIVRFCARLDNSEPFKRR